MGYEPPKYSRNKVNYAGDILAKRKKIKSSDKLDAMSILSNWRAAHAYPINTFQSTLRDRLKKIDASAIVGQRLKRAPSIIEKLKRFKTMNLAQMQDIGGLRSVLLSVSKLRKLEEVYRSPRFTHELFGWNDYINKPKTDGYRGLHLIFKYRSTKSEALKYNNLLIELQLRTKIQHDWATAVETMDIYLGQAIKLGKGNRRWKRFFKYTSMAFSILESSPPVPGFKNISEKKVFEEVRKMDSELKVLEKLEGFSIATDMILNDPGVGVYNLFMLNISERTVRIRPYPLSKLNEANDELTRLERKHAGDGNVDIVLLSAGPLKQLKKAYPNYFLDTYSFIKRVKRIINLSKESKKKFSAAKFHKKGKRKTYGVRRDVKNLLFSGDIPQADNLDSVKKVVEVVNNGLITQKEISLATGYSPRHVQYKIATAVILGFLEKLETIKVTQMGKAWLQKKVASNEESVFLKKCIEQTKVYQLIARDLFDSARPDKEILAKRIMDYGNLSESTALRRASTLIAWSNRIMQHYLPLDRLVP